MDPIRLEPRPELRRPVMVFAFRGWNDGGEAATSAVAYLRDRWEAERFGTLDPEEFVDFQVTRPVVRLEDGLTRRIDWPEGQFFHAARSERDVVLFLGIEPNMRWRTMVDALLKAAGGLGVESVVTMGAFLADVPHTMATPIAGSAGTAEQAAALGISPSGYEGPTGIVGVLHDAAVRAGFSSVSLWAAVPHYLPAGPNPKASLALVEKLAAATGVQVETDTLARAAAAWEEQISGTIQDNEELRTYVERLEAGAEERPTPTDLPSGETLAAELEQFLRDQRGKGELASTVPLRSRSTCSPIRGPSPKRARWPRSPAARVGPSGPRSSG
jgi:predicted ATP-grasp superfamily ATP-dependent carboligase